MNDDHSNSLFIKDLIRRVHDELYESRCEREASGQDPIFEVSMLTLEVNFVVVQKKGMKGGLDFRVITAGADKAYEQQQVQKVTLSLSALPDDESDSLEFSDPARKFRPREIDDEDDE
jgi:Trypsin-co-occurring domain 2